MWRGATGKLENWKNSTNRKPLLLVGTRTVGKTWLLREFGRVNYKNTVYVSFNGNSGWRHIFEAGHDALRIIRDLAAFTKVEISPKNTLIILDDIQWCPAVLLALKAFYKTAPQYHIAAAGNFLEIMCAEELKVAENSLHTITIYPMTFMEFLNAADDSGLCAKAMKSRDWNKIAALHEKLMEFLNEYFFVGGMPAAVKKFLEAGKDGTDTRREHEMILAANYADFSQRAGDKTLSARAEAIWNSIPQQLLTQNRRFLYSRVRAGSRGRDFEAALEWLKNARMVHVLNRVKAPRAPLENMAEKHIFKLYLPDIGLMCAQCGLDWRHGDIIGSGTAEQFVFQELIANDHENRVFYWNGNKNYGEIEFLLETGKSVVPIKVRLNESRRGLEGIKFYKTKFRPENMVHLTLGQMLKHDTDPQLPLYMIGLSDE